MLLIDKLLTIIAPHECVRCGREGSLLCLSCAPEACLPVPSRCYRCKKLTKDFATCQSCRSSSALGHVWVCTEYEGVSKKLIYKLKFKSARSAAMVIALRMNETLPVIPGQAFLVHVPTATRRRRQRSFDHALLITRELSKVSGMAMKDVLIRSGQTRQVGAHRDQRLKQLKDAFRAHSKDIGEARVLLVDDIVTTGGTLDAAARALKRAGVKRVDAIVLAQK